ncbi:hypothetical protein MHM84_20235 [Halomonas sp. McH1-25]|uniref:hypothetical protein n=1 Tax=unclassified Halomonas TaxID=2609666 RepID=UPI001EF44D4F|nr:MULTISPECIES: hypothetical protein [unclassified Halomonas]MCG7602074.1 hypothetical protein [Halomonas sp. McH1-25]MCP1342910.1 hypothetical protein [Halomonas sp. FL8]MCP1362529.1 hypothetical protein [Halomonas sp. BBD45]MCP1363959.1 hypothetical protein [Halomonas sp. BBD48]
MNTTVAPSNYPPAIWPLSIDSRIDDSQSSQGRRWRRYLTDDVRIATRAKLSRTSRSKTAQDEDAQIIEEASNAAAAAATNHRQAVVRWRSIWNRLEGAMDSDEITEDNHDKMARSLISGIDALGKATRLGRPVYSLDGEQQPDQGKTMVNLMADLAEAEKYVDRTVSGME